jgi:peptidyl-prolyl cis-trans isomerase A (cyclophilin A)
VFRRTLIAALALMAPAVFAMPAFAQAVATQPPPAPEPDMGRIVRVDLDTKAGKIVLELYPDKAPITVANFLHYVNTRRFDGAEFFRAARAPGAPTFGLIQGGGLKDASRLYPPIKLEPTSQTGLHHGDGAVSMARAAPNSARADFFILVGESPSLDANPSAPGDKLGFAAFGRVAEGMDVVRAILAMPTEGHARTPGMQGQILTAPVPIVTAREEK